MELTSYLSLFSEIKFRIREAQIKATLAANSQMIRMYWDIGKMISQKQLKEGWGANVIQKLSIDLKNELPELKGFSERNLKYMLKFSTEYAFVQQSVAQLYIIENQEVAKVQQPVALLQQPFSKFENSELLLSIPWGHNITLIEKIKNVETRFWYMRQTIENGWSRDILTAMIKSNAFERQGSFVNNFQKHLPNYQSDLVKQTLKDPYIFDFLTLADSFAERELETELIKHIEKFLLELGTGFAFVGRQYHFEVDKQDFYIDLLFYHLQMRCFIVIDLKKGIFKPEYAGKMNFYCSVVDDILKNKNDELTIGLILCENKNKIVAEYALKDTKKPIGVSEYEFTRALPENLKSSLPSIEDLENELSNKINNKTV